MSESVVTNKVFVGGILVNVHSHSDGGDSSLPVHALFLLHGRTLSAESVVPTAKSILEFTYAPDSNRKRDLIIITITVTMERDSSTPCATVDGTGTPLKTTLTMPGTAHDLSFLIDHIPAYLYPQAERNIIEWGVAGISLGGHSTWIALTREPRIQLAIPIIGCPDYTRLMSRRAHDTGTPFEAPSYPHHLRAYVDAYDPVNFPFRKNDTTNPFLGKRILVLSGVKDKLVPWDASKELVEGLEVGDGIKRVVLEEDAGHRCTPAMTQEAALFVTDWLAK